MEKTTACTARGPEDVLGYIPHAVGFLPRESLVCLTATGKELGATLRVDLPRRGSRPGALWDYALAVLAYLEHDVGSDGTFLALYEGTPLSRIEAGRRQLLTALEEVLAAAGRPVRDVWLVGADGWNGLGCREGVCTVPVAGPERRGAGPCRHSLDLISDSRLAAEMVFRGSAVLEHPDDLPAPQAGSAGSSPGAPASRSGAGHRGEELTVDRLSEVLTAWEGVLDGSITWPEIRETGRENVLSAALEEPSLRDAVYVSAGSCRETAWWGSIEAGVVDLVQGSPGAPRPKDGLPWIERFGAVVIAETPEGPEWPRMERFAVALQNMRTDAGREAPAGILTALGWVEWCRGRGSHASALLSQAVETASCQPLAPLLLQLVLAGRLSGWAMRRETSWRRSQRDG